MTNLGPDELNFMEYVRRNLDNNTILFDVGANQGDFTAEWLRRFPGSSQSIAFEPIVDVFIKLEDRFEDSVYVEFEMMGLSDHTHTAVINYIPNSSGMSSLYDRAVFDEASRGFQRATRRIFLTTLDEWLEVYRFARKIDYLKIDTEGHEFAVLRGAAESLKRHQIKYIQIEVGGCWFESQTRLVDVVKYLDAFGYRLRGPDLVVIDPDNCPTTFWERGDRMTVVNMLAEVK